MKNFGLVLFFFFFVTKAVHATNYSSEPKLFVEELVSEAIQKLSDKSLSQEDKEKFIEEVAKDNVDINALGLYTLGEIRKTADENTLANYQNAFRKYFLKSLTSRLSDYSSNEFVVIDAEIKSSNYTMVKSKIKETSKQPEN